MRGTLRLTVAGRAVTITGGPFDAIPDGAFGVCLEPEAAKAWQADVALPIADFGVPEMAALRRAVAAVLAFCLGYARRWENGYSRCCRVVLRSSVARRGIQLRYCRCCTATASGSDCGKPGPCRLLRPDIAERCLGLPRDGLRESRIKCCSLCGVWQSGHAGCGNFGAVSIRAAAFQ
ncbi:hypothetical protein J4558_23495 [Leptolyngbya sp. 15MV]|nr:hypothetical protein J4558_23495 [Leptolyngbya sp. 15MV]